MVYSNITGFVEGGAMSVMAVAAVILARAETAGLPVSPRFAANPTKPGAQPVTTAGLKSCREALAKWGWAEFAAPTLDLLYRADLLVWDKGNMLRPAPAAYSWLQLPPALANRLLLEGSGKTLKTDFLTSLIEDGLQADPENRPMIMMLLTLGLVQKMENGWYFAQPKAVNLLVALAQTDPAAPPDDPAQLALAQEWLLFYPGKAAGKGWLKWQPDLFCYTFPAPVTGQRLTFDPWQLFRLAQLCQPSGTEANLLFLQPTPGLMAEASLRGIAVTTMQVYLNEGLYRALPRESLAVLDSWLYALQRYRVRPTLILEAADRTAMQLLLDDSRLRSYFQEQISPRHVAIQRKDLGQVQQLMARRRHFLQLEPSLQPLASHSKTVNFVLTRAQFLEVATAMLLYRRLQVEEGYFPLEADGLLGLLEENLSLREYAEVENRAGELHFPPTNLPQVEVEISEAEMKELARKLEQAINQEAELLIEYSVPGRPAQQRRIEPLALRQKDGYFYLTAYCYLRKDERLFRLDRMKLLEVKNPD